MVNETKRYNSANKYGQKAGDTMWPSKLQTHAITKLQVFGEYFCT